MESKKRDFPHCHHWSDIKTTHARYQQCVLCWETKDLHERPDLDDINKTTVTHAQLVKQIEKAMDKFFVLLEKAQKKWTKKQKSM